MGMLRLFVLLSLKPFLSYKLRCYTRISSSEKSDNNTREKIRYFFSRVFDIANQLLTRHSPFAPLGQVDEQTAKPSPFLIQSRLSKFFRIMAAKTLKNPHRVKHSRRDSISTRAHVLFSISFFTYLNNIVDQCFASHPKKLVETSRNKHNVEKSLKRKKHTFLKKGE